MPTPILTCLGAAGTVTGSRHLLEYGQHRVLIDCGLFQERHLQAHNWDAFNPPASSLSAVLLTHGHLDHCGLLPRLVAQGFTGRVHATPATCAIAPIVMADSARLQMEDAAFKRKRHAKEGRENARGYQPLYDDDDVQAAVARLTPAGMGKRVVIAPGIEAAFFHAGHILGSASIAVTAGTGADRRTVLFSGDLGRRHNPLVPDAAILTDCDAVVIESTYGDRLHEPTADIGDALAAAILPAAQRGGTVVVPCFAVERAQELLWHLGRLFRAKRLPAMPVYLDSPMAQRLLEVFRSHPEATSAGFSAADLDFPGLHLTHGQEDSKAINERQGPMIVIAGSGMCTGGRIKHHLQQRLGDARNLVLFVGYQADGTLGRQILQGAKRVRLFGGEREVNAQVAQVRGFSGHADRDELLGWLSRLPHRPRQVVVVHGGPNVSASFAQLVTERTQIPAQAATAGVPIPLM